jgi:hypothetical protein
MYSVPNSITYLSYSSGPARTPILRRPRRACTDKGDTKSGRMPEIAATSSPGAILPNHLTLSVKDNNGFPSITRTERR